MGKKIDKKITLTEATKQITVLKKDLFNLRFKKINNQIDNPAKFEQTRKQIARLMTTLKDLKNDKKNT
tara:strand:- start:1361 stop:1564 length:204 start_codon:yes stop_codon:yes gene_type:complete